MRRSSCPRSLRPLGHTRNQPWPWTLPRRGKEATQPGPLLPRAGMDVPASGSPGAPLLYSSGCLMAWTGSQLSVAHTSGAGRVLPPQRSACGPCAGHLSGVRRVGPAGGGAQHTLSIGAGLPRLLSVLFHAALDHVVLTSAALHQQEPSPGIENPSAVQSLSIPSS